MMQVIGWNHRTCPLPLREKLAMAASAIPAFLQQFQRQFPWTEVVLLSTCNRLELYSVGDRPGGPSRDQALAFLAGSKGIRPGDLIATHYFYEQAEAVRHLFAVAASLDSMVVGESQVIGQVRRAYEIARRRSATGAYTHRVFQAAIHAARRVASETDLGRHRISIPRLAVTECARQLFHPLHDKLVVVVGAGAMAMETLRALKDEGAGQIAVINHHDEKARALADRFGAQPWSWDDLPRAFCQADLVVTATGSPSPIVRVEDFRQWTPARRDRTLLILDLGVPRDVDPHLGTQQGVFLFSIDDLRNLAERNRQRREEALRQAYEIVDEETLRFIEQMNARTASAGIRQWKRLSAQAQADELRRLFNKLPDLDERSRAAIRHALARYAGKLMHPIVASLKAGSAAECHAASQKPFRQSQRAEKGAKT